MNDISSETIDVVVVGAGFSGLYAMYRLRELGLSARAFEAGADVGGTWYWNRYPGARCDVESMDYQYSFCADIINEWDWSERFPAQAEILSYLQFVADRYELRRDYAFHTRVVAAHLDDETGHWSVTTDTGETVQARFVVMATGCLSTRYEPDLPGLYDFSGQWVHTGAWPHAGLDLTGKKVGVIGTGSTGIQAIPVIAEQAERLFVFQRTPQFTIPAQNRDLTEQERSWVRDNWSDLRRNAERSPSGVNFPVNLANAMEVSAEERTAEYEKRWDEGGAGYLASFADLRTSVEANETAAEFVRQKIAAAVHDKELAARLQPRGYPLGAKRICVDTDYYLTFNRSNVDLVDLRDEPLVGLVPEGVKTEAAVYPVDVLVLATGYDAITGPLLHVDIRGRQGTRLADRWADGPRTYLGLQTSGFPNLFMVTGPGSPSVHSNMVVSIEQHVDWITECLRYLETHALTSIEPTPDAESRWMAHVNEVASAALYHKTNSWYLGANVPGKPLAVMTYQGGVGAYREICEAVVDDDYRGFVTA